MSFPVRSLTGVLASHTLSLKRARSDNREINPMDKNGILINLSESDRTKFGKEDFGTQWSGPTF